ncbi:acyltransferase [Sphaerisporangium melleum]|uniref:Acyltransferase n=1 Tax=Sphaerisporangium melleum TaxID=321316 RepID=A0A917RKE5_9ACTN|nr:acyltransferase [Sphaerisporangium melleum]GGL10558.1 acyltransferase [Sphaerisporangium melleum]GII70723.1 acyltransferase [Sphaerisporangium melleum]
MPMAPTAPQCALSGRRAALPSLTGLRFAAAMLVFLFHITLSNSPVPPNAAINPFMDEGLADGLEWLFSKAGYMGVSFFFVLSGFVLTWSAKPGEPMRTFWRRRALKIFPNHLVTFAASMILFAGAFTPVIAWLPNIFLLHGFIPFADIYVSVNPPAWTLCCELLFYALFPVLAKPIGRIRENRLLLWAGVMIAGTVAVQLITLFLIPDTPKSPITPVSVTQFWFGYIFPVPRLLEFVLGMLLARAVIAGVAPKIHLWQALVASVAGYALALYVPFVFGFSAATIIPIAALLIAFAAADLRGARTGLRGRTAQWLGEISFGFYICQGVVVFYGRLLLPDRPFATPVALLVVAGFFAATLLAGWLLYAGVENPMMKRWARPRRPVRSAVPAIVEVAPAGQVVIEPAGPARPA